MTSTRWWHSFIPWSRPSHSPAPPALARPAATRPTAGVAQGAPPAPIDPAATAASHPAFLLWLLAHAPEPAAAHGAAAPSAPHPAELQMLDQLDRVIGSDALCGQLLPRAPDVVPRLLKTLRDDSYSSADVAQRISRDVVLTAEVIRMATSTFHGADRGTPDLARAVAVIGTQGLRRAISRVVLRPLFDAHGSSLSARAAPQIWEDADKKARLCVALAAGRPIDPLDAYLVGLLHNTGWSAALRVIDGLATPPPPAALAHPRIAEALFLRRDRLFSKLVPSWGLGAELAGLADDIGRAGLDAAVSPLAQLLRQAQSLALLHSLQARGDVAGGVVAPPDLSPAVRETYQSLSLA